MGFLEWGPMEFSNDGVPSSEKDVNSTVIKVERSFQKAPLLIFGNYGRIFARLFGHSFLWTIKLTYQTLQPSAYTVSILEHCTRKYIHSVICPVKTGSVSIWPLITVRVLYWDFKEKKTPAA